MISATTIADAGQITKPRDEIYDIYTLYAETVLTDPARERETRDRQGYFHPSAISMCARMNVYGARYEPFTLHYGVQDFEIFEYGHFIHGRVQKVLSEVRGTAARQGIQVHFEEEVPFDSQADVLWQDLRTGGTTDGLLTLEKPGVWKQRGVVEIKTMKDEYWEKAKEPSRSHQLQAHLYAFRFDCPIIWFWYFNKNTGKHRVFPVAFNHEILDEALTRLEMFNQHLEADTLPDREESWYSCTRCEFRDTCDPLVLKPKRRRSQPAQKNLTTVSRRNLIRARKKGK